MVDILLWSEVFMLLLFLMSPSATFLDAGWKSRRQEILSGLSSKEHEAIKSYFRQFHPTFAREVSDYQLRFEKYYDSQFGRHHFIVPMALLGSIAAVLLLQCFFWLRGSIVAGQSIMAKPETIAVFAVMGAFLWVLNDQISRWLYMDLSPGDLYWASFRFMVSIPMAYAVSGLVAENVAVTLAFFLGAFPTSTLLSLFRKIGRQRLGLAETSEGGESELQRLHGIDTLKAERFASEGITTVSQLAYSDPIRLTIRTNLGYSYIVDCVAQALLWIYVEQDHEKWRRTGIRGAFEVINLLNELGSNVDSEATEAKALILNLSTVVGCNEVAIRKVIREVAQDPYAQFIYSSWTGYVE